MRTQAARSRIGQRSGSARRRRLRRPAQKQRAEPGQKPIPCPVSSPSPARAAADRTGGIEHWFRSGPPRRHPPFSLCRSTTSLCGSTGSFRPAAMMRPSTETDTPRSMCGFSAGYASTSPCKTPPTVAASTSTDCRSSANRRRLAHRTTSATCLFLQRPKQTGRRHRKMGHAHSGGI